MNVQWPSKVLSTTGTLASALGTIQPFRYRGYVYDVETELYYLRSRYYNPDWGRFINTDTIIGENLFSYCDSSPITYSDPDGHVIRYGLDIPWYGYFHEKVVKQVATSNGLQKEQRIKNGIFRVDLLKDNHYVYEVKSEPRYNAERVINKAHQQTSNYIKDTDLEKGDATQLILPIFEPLVIGSCTIEVSVRAEEELIIYKVTVQKNDPDFIPVLRKETELKLSGSYVPGRSENALGYAISLFSAAGLGFAISRGAGWNQFSVATQFVH